MKEKKPTQYGVPRPPKAVKGMDISPEDFFITALAGFGPPNRDPFMYYWRQGNFMMGGVAAWCQYNERGRLWTALVMQTGEAKSRAHRWYMQYHRWWRDKGREARAAGLI